MANIKVKRMSKLRQFGTRIIIGIMLAIIMIVGSIIAIVLGSAIIYAVITIIGLIGLVMLVMILTLSIPAYNNRSVSIRRDDDDE